MGCTLTLSQSRHSKRYCGCTLSHSLTLSQSKHTDRQCVCTLSHAHNQNTDWQCLCTLSLSQSRHSKRYCGYTLTLSTIETRQTYLYKPFNYVSIATHLAANVEHSYPDTMFNCNPSQTYHDDSHERQF